jgi:hypothetical protein
LPRTHRELRMASHPSRVAISHEPPYASHAKDVHRSRERSERSAKVDVRDHEAAARGYGWQAASQRASAKVVLRSQRPASARSALRRGKAQRAFGQSSVAASAASVWRRRTKEDVTDNSSFPSGAALRKALANLCRRARQVTCCAGRHAQAIRLRPQELRDPTALATAKPRIAQRVVRAEGARRARPAVTVTGASGTGSYFRRDG